MDDREEAELRAAAGVLRDALQRIADAAEQEMAGFGAAVDEWDREGQELFAAREVAVAALSTTAVRDELARREKAAHNLKLAEALLESIASECECAVAAFRRRGQGGQQVPYHGPFAAATPGVVNDLERLGQRARAYDAGRRRSP